MMQAPPAPPLVISAGDTAWVLASSALVLLMTVGLACFYSGLVRSKNSLNTMMMSIVAMGAIGVQWVLLGYSLAFAPGSGWLGGLAWVALRGVGAEPNPAYAATIPQQAHAVYQAMFAVITPALISGAIVARMRFRAYIAFLVLWSTLVYAPLAHWVWGAGGWLQKMGALDFAGGTVVHVSAGVSALVAAWFLGPRRDYRRVPISPHNVPLVLIGAGMLWFGWFGFNAGSALAANGLAAQAFLNTNNAAAAAMLGWLVVERLKGGHATTLGAASGAVAGLVAITPCAGYVGGISPIIIGFVAGAVCFMAIQLKFRFGYDDALDVIGVHLVGGIAGSLLLGLFADKAVNPDFGANGLFFGGGLELLGYQAVAVLATMVWSGGISFVLAKVISATIGLRCNDEEEIVGLDLSQHAETAYSFGE